VSLRRRSVARRGIGTNAYIVGIDGSECTRATPRSLGLLVSDFAFRIAGWLVGSSRGNDSIHFGPGRGIYVSRDDRFVSEGRRSFYRQSNDGRHELCVRYDPDSGTTLEVSGRELKLPFGFDALHYASWSPNGRLLALSVTPAIDSLGHADWEEVWVVDVDRSMTSSTSPAHVNVIDLQERFCTYSFLGATAEFITDRTMAVSMHADGDAASSLWEITTDGRRVRQLTR
jgi:hypothetical protein